jgi:excisionase family DNA binding protein
MLTAQQVCEILHIDRSTVYRMAEDGRLAAIRVGKQWRFPSDEIHALVPSGVFSPVAASRAGSAIRDYPERARVGGAVVEVAADLLGVMMLVTDMEGRPATEVANPCGWFAEHADEPSVLATCVSEWRALAEDHDFTPRFTLGGNGFECARAFIRSGRELTGMVLAGGVAPSTANPLEGAGGNAASDLYHLSDAQRDAVLRALPRVAGAISRHADLSVAAQSKESE